MNRSIAKTRNQLQRITYKINQLKTKYTGDNYHPPPTGIENSPVQYKEKQFSENRARETIPFQSKFNQLSGNKMEKVSAGDEEIYQKQLKMFRNEMYNYIDKCLVLSKERQQQLIEKVVQTHLENSRAKAKNGMEERIKKIEQQTTDCLSSIQDTIIQLKKNEKHFNDKVNNAEQKLRKEMKEMGQNSEQKNKEIDRKYSEMIKRIQRIQQQYSQVKASLQKQNTTNNNINQKVGKMCTKVNGIQEKLGNKFTQAYDSYEQLIMSNCLSLKKQIQKCTQAKVEMENKISQLIQKIKQNEQCIQQKADSNELYVKIQQEMSKVIEQKYSKQAQNICKINSELRCLAQIINSNSLSKEIMKQMEANFKKIMLEQIQSIHQFHQSSKQTDSSQTHSQRHKNSQQIGEQQYEDKRVHEKVDEKLNQFENDINQTIKLLYENIENKVNQMLMSTGVMELRADFQCRKKEILNLNTQVHSLNLLLTTSNPQNNSIKATQSNGYENLKSKQLESIRSQIYQDMGQQIDKISCLLERTVQQMETKVQKLDHNFSYVYERMSNIEYDNANFKDKLTSLLSGNKLSPLRCQKASEPDLMHNNTFLDVLGQLNSGKVFFGDA